MAIPLENQFQVEKQRNRRYLVLSLITNLLFPLFHGILFLWVPWLLRYYRSLDSLRFLPYFNFLKVFKSFTSTFQVRVFRKNFYFQPSLLLTGALHVSLNAYFCVAQTKEIDYQSFRYVVSKRLGLVCIAQVPAVLLLVTKNNFVSAVSGVSLDKAVFFHKWLGRFMFVSAILHMALALEYWIAIKFYIMVKIPPQIFGFIAFSCLGMMNIGSFKFIRNYAFELFLAQHRIFNFIFLLLAYFHNHLNRFPVVLGVHLLVLDRIVGRVLGIIHKRRSSTKGKCDFEIIDEMTTRVTIPVKISSADPRKWWWCFVPRYGSWRAGQHVLFNCNKVALLAYHPFTISSLSSSGKMVLVIRKKGGFTKQLLQKLEKMESKEDEEKSAEARDSPATSDHGFLSSSVGKKVGVNITAVSDDSLRDLLGGFQKTRNFFLKAGMNGPFGANYQPLTKFETIAFFSAGSGSSFTLPVALDLLKDIEARDRVHDYLYRPERCKVAIHATFQKKAHLKWYDHLWEEFYPFLLSGKAHLYLYFTRETSSDNSTVVPETLDEKKYETELITSQEGLLVFYARPAIGGLVSSYVNELRSQSYRHSLACLGCGPPEFNFAIQDACEKNRWQPGAPEIYLYLESFD